MDRKVGSGFLRTRRRVGRRTDQGHIGGVGMSFQITILKVLAGHPEGRASLPDLKRAISILITSGSEWTDRMKRLAARAPDLDIFSQSLVLRTMRDGKLLMPAGCFSISFKHQSSRRPMTERFPKSLQSRSCRRRRLR
jgi:hypothetical protein